MALLKSAPLPSGSRPCLDRAAALLDVRGSYALRSQAQQQAALELLQARRLGAHDAQLEAVLLRQVRASVAGLLRDPALAPGLAMLRQSIPPADQGDRVSRFVQAEAAQWLPPSEESAA